MFRLKIWPCILCFLCAILLCSAGFAEEIEIELPPAEQGPVVLTDDMVAEPEVISVESQPVEADMTAASDFPDNNFRQYVLKNFDKNSDGSISSSEAKKVKTIDVSRMGIVSLQGIEKFTRLYTLKCSGNGIERLNLDGNKSLEKLWCDGNPIEEIEIGKCTKLVKYAKEIFPSISAGTMLFQTTSGGKRKTMIALPEGTAIYIKGTAFFDPRAGFELANDDFLLTVKQKKSLLAEGCGYPPEYCKIQVNKKGLLKFKSGVMKGSKAGKLKVKVTTFDGQSIICKVTVMNVPTKVTLSMKELKLGVGQTCQLKAAVPKDSVADYTWSTSRSSVATVNNGLVKAKKAGTATITVRTQNGKKDTCKVTVYEAPTSLTLNVDHISLTPGQTFALKPSLNKGASGIITLTSEDPEIARVNSENGVITAVSDGATTIWAETFNGLRASCKVVVMDGAKQIIVDSEAMINVGQSADLEAVALTASGEDVSDTLSYRSSNENVVTVSAAGIVRALRAGTATITISAPNGVKATCRLTVVKTASAISLNRKELSLKYDTTTEEGETFQLVATLNGGASEEITFESDDYDVAWVDDDGLVTALGVGRANIIAETESGLRAVCVVTVSASASIPDDDDPDFDTGDVIVVAHRGGLSCGPENTLEAFSNSASTGADMIELDVRTTKDGIEVINHDAKISGKKIKDKKYSELLEYKSDLCTLDEALDVIYDSGLLLQVELKDTADVTKTVNAVRSHDMEDRVIYISFEKDLLRKVRKLEPTARLGFIFMDSVPSGLNSFIDELDISALMVHWKLLTQSRLDSWHDMGLKVNVWTIDDYNDCVEWINMGVDFITSNYPEIAVSARG